MARLKNWKTLFKLTGPALFVFFLLGVVDFKAVLDLLARIRLDIIVISAVLFPLLTTALTFRWWLICKQLGMSASFTTLTGIYYAAWFLGILPLTGTSAAAKILYLRNSGERTATTLVSLAFDKLLDIAGLLLFGICGALYLPKGIIKANVLLPIWAGALLAAMVIIAVGPHLWKQARVRLNHYLSDRLKKFGSHLESSLADLWAEFDLTTFFKQLLLAIIINLLRASVLYVLAAALDINISFLQAIACRALIGIVNFVPVSNSGLGTRDAVLLLVLPLWGVSPSAALTLGLTAFFWTLFPKAAGIIFWLKLPIPLREIRAATSAAVKQRPDKTR